MTADLVNIGLESEKEPEVERPPQKDLGSVLEGFDLLEYHQKDWQEIKNRIETLKAEMEKKELWIAQHCCPYKQGMRLKTNKGLGLVGLVVQEIVAPKVLGKWNRWEVVCYAIAKNGEVTRRIVSFDEADAKELIVTIVSGG